MPGRRSRRRWPWLAVLLTAVLAVLTGCQVTTTVGVHVAGDGSGAVRVQVTLDRQADAAVGGLARQLDTSGLAAAGWTTTRPALGPDDSVVVTATHRFTRLAQVPAILAEVAGPGPARKAKTPYVLHLTRTQTAHGTAYTATGTVDLRCGLSCFGDAALQKSFGSAVGVDPSSLEGKDGAAVADKDLTFRLAVTLPGSLTASPGASRDGSTATWKTALGRATSVHGSSLVDPVKPAAGPAAVNDDRGVTRSPLLLAGVLLLVLLVAGAVWGLVVVVRRRPSG
ncbi:MAG TPA: hypothetical protein VKV06_00280 [Acidimicrobiales bacterium]|nr:hypothetical protein [Acidimicrobiales bacterium]